MTSSRSAFYLHPEEYFNNLSLIKRSPEPAAAEPVPLNAVPSLSGRATANQWENLQGNAMSWGGPRQDRVLDGQGPQVQAQVPRRRRRVERLERPGRVARLCAGRVQPQGQHTRLLARVPTARPGAGSISLDGATGRVLVALETEMSRRAGETAAWTSSSRAPWRLLAQDVQAPRGMGRMAELRRQAQAREGD
ncbi:hypothetical protein VTK56DRAFT_2085 [Thermocarpiscus australiensis]